MSSHIHITQLTLLPRQCSYFLQSYTGWSNLLLNISSKNRVNSQRASLTTKNGIRDEICSLETAIFMHNLVIIFPETSHFAVFETARLCKLLYTRKGASWKCEFVLKRERSSRPRNCFYENSKSLEMYVPGVAL